MGTQSVHIPAPSPISPPPIFVPEDAWVCPLPGNNSENQHGGAFMWTWTPSRVSYGKKCFCLFVSFFCMEKIRAELKREIGPPTQMLYRSIMERHQVTEKHCLCGNMDCWAKFMLNKQCCALDNCFMEKNAAYTRIHDGCLGLVFPLLYLCLTVRPCSQKRKMA